MKPRISVCIDCFNYGRYLAKAVESVLRQTFQDFEILIFDDASRDDSFEIAQQLALRDSRIRVFRNAQNLGMVGNRNACLGQARGEYVKFVHADDFLAADDALSKLAAVLDAHPQISLVASAWVSVNASMEALETSRRRLAPGHQAGRPLIRRCLREMRNLPGPPSAVMFRRAAVAGGFNTAYSHAADLEMWFRLLEMGDFHWIDEPLCAYRWHDLQMTEREKATPAAAEDWHRLLGEWLVKPFVEIDDCEKWMLRAIGENDLHRQCRKLRLDTSAKPRVLAGSFRWLLRQKRLLERLLASKR